MSEKNAGSFRLLPKGAIARTLAFFDKVSIIFVDLRIHPNFLSYLGFAAGVAAGIFFFFDLWIWAAVSIIVCGIFDILDGKVAHQANKKSRFGAILDSSLDRYGEFSMFFGLAYHFRNHWGLWIILLALQGSIMVSYTRARAEGLGIDCGLGIMQRAERFVALFLGTVIGILFKVFDPAMITVLIVIALASNVTAFQRIFAVRKFERSNPASQDPKSQS